MRDDLGNFAGKRLRFRGTFVRYGTKKGFLGRGLLTTVLMANVIELSSQRVVTDHVWFTETNGFLALGELQRGEEVEFDARVKKYKKGYWGYRNDDDMPAPGFDWKLSHPTKIVRLHAPPPKTEQLTLF